MSATDHFRLLASYNEWMNSKLYAAVGSMPPEAISKNVGAFFGSLLGTLNHIVVADTLWLKRFALHPAGSEPLAPILPLPHPMSLDQIIFSDFAELRQHRVFLDSLIIRWANSLTDDQLSISLKYVNTGGAAFSKRFYSLVMHFFNHQTHHRGQATALLSQAGIDIGSTDLNALIPNEL